MLDSDLAKIYGVATGAFNQAVKRNASRFPADFRFQLTKAEFENLKSQSVTSSSRHGGRRKLPWVFTEHGAVMAATVLNSPQAVEMSIFVVRAFVRFREMAAGHTKILKKLDKLEKKVADHDEVILDMFAALRALIENPKPKRRRIGFGEETRRD